MVFFRHSLFVTRILASALLATLASLHSAVAQTAASSPLGTSSPRIEFAATICDVGKVEPGQAVRHDFVFTNTGNALLEIREVRPWCTCTTVGAWEKRIAPGKTGVVPVRFDAAGPSGSLARTLTVTSNDPAQTNVFLKLKCTIWRPFDATPMFVVFNLPPDLQTNETKVVKIVSNLDEPLTLSDPASASPAFRAELKTVKAGKEFELRITVVTPVGPANVSAPISLKTSSPKIPEITVPAYAMLQPRVAAGQK